MHVRDGGTPSGGPGREGRRGARIRTPGTVRSRPPDPMLPEAPRTREGAGTPKPDRSRRTPTRRSDDPEATRAVARSVAVLIWTMEADGTTRPPDPRGPAGGA